MQEWIRICRRQFSRREEVERQGIETPAIIVVGKVCKLAADFGWYEKLSLAGWKVLVTRPKGRSSRTADDLRRRGAEVLELPSVRTVALDEQTELWQAFDRMDTYQWITFTSPTGAEIFFEELKNAHKDIRSLAGVHIAAIGQGTAKVLEERGILVDLIPEIYDGDALGEALAAKLTGGEKILLPRARKGNENLVKILKTHGARVDDIAAQDLQIIPVLWQHVSANRQKLRLMHTACRHMWQKKQRLRL